MSKLSTAAALLLAAPLAFAQTTTQPPQNDTVGQKADRVFDRAENATSRTVNPAPGEPTVGQRADGVFDRMEAGTKRVWNRVTGKSEAAPTNATVANDPRTMGAPADPNAPRR